MNTLYISTLSIGLIFLLLSFILDGLSDVFQGLSFFDLGGDVLPGFLPMTPLEICGFLTGFGGMGYTVYGKTSLHLLFAILCGFILSFLVNRLMHHLKKTEGIALSEGDLIGMEGRVIGTIFEGGTGSIALETDFGKISYLAQSDHPIKEGTIIKVIDVQGHILMVTDDPAYFLSKLHS